MNKTYNNTGYITCINNNRNKISLETIKYVLKRNSKFFDSVKNKYTTKIETIWLTKILKQSKANLSRKEYYNLKRTVRLNPEMTLSSVNGKSATFVL